MNCLREFYRENVIYKSFGYENKVMMVSELFGCKMKECILMLEWNWKVSAMYLSSI